MNPNDETSKAKFQEINEANEVLSNPESRKKYDQYGKDWKHVDEFDRQKQQQKQYSGQQGGGFSGGQGGEDYSSFFESMFGNASNGSRQRTSSFKGQDFAAEIKLNLVDVLIAQKQTLTVNGKNIRITIPAGVANGQTIKIKGHGAPGVNGGPNGDLFISFIIENTTFYKREGANLYKEVEIDLLTAVLGGEMTVDTLSSKVKLTIKAGVQNNTKVKLKGKGMPIYKKGSASTTEEFEDLIITYTVKIPTNLTEKQIELFKEIAKSY